ncbi:hypothetical protein NQF87_03200 [Bombella sp. TMW 2.2559]|uniref:Uncharacterized protein n=1 Tax=Bombella dulcis TaxID=2967339 RepID=A0ABT3WGI6_9PROT|nr:hypothetical protein [Bombella dulcis]MCX5615986.1 hypothetical protein [Bombella dulcis]
MLMSGRGGAYSFERVWFLDCYGHLISYNNYWSELVRIPLQGILVSGYYMGAYPFPKDCQVKVWDIFGNMLDVPHMSLLAWRDGLVSFYCAERQAYVTIDPGTNRTGWAAHVADWEKFLPLTQDAFEGLLILSDPVIGRIKTESGDEVDYLQFVHSQERKVFTAGFGRKRINIRSNIENFSKIGRLKIGESSLITFFGFMSGRTYNLVVTRLGPVNF